MPGERGYITIFPVRIDYAWYNRATNEISMPRALTDSGRVELKKLGRSERSQPIMKPLSLYFDLI
jgi:hypothetical protein